ncbi:hypothetical protein [Enterobacter hormaechei]|uniref:hypothetical protein n=1 Tax=Enterobacter hormaechei TaxID=158836 RepID=UPI001BD651FC|nr:hypothetical protein [Enterobacter hormaechei]EHN8715628.1 hypothetical protein [Enterobacter hormaechei]MDO6166573.1 hypothetical protein [Enterobacter hormaechei]MDO6170602.1 hypothetical protein [Enterobacter hormaechei]
MTNVSAVEKMAELMQQMEENSPRVAALQYCLKQVAEKVEDAEKRNAELEARCAALAAELQSVKVMNDCLSEELRGYESDGAFEGPKMHLLWWQCETPNLHYFLAEVRAQGVEMFAKEMHADISGDDAREFAAQLRKGGATEEKQSFLSDEDCHAFVEAFTKGAAQ